MATGLAVAGFTAGLFDSVVGGGGVITLPTLLWAGLSPYTALGTNKLAGTFASSVSSFNFARSGNIDRSLMAVMAPFTFVGAVVGAETALGVSERYLTIVILVVIVAISVLTLLRRDLGNENHYSGLSAKTAVLGVAIAFALGFYDGFIGPGTGTFLLFLFLTVFRFDFVIGAGNGRVLNFASNVGALLLFLARGKVAYGVGLVMGVSLMAGAMTGSRFAIRRGTRWIRPLFVGVALVLAAKMALDVFVH